MTHDEMINVIAAHDTGASLQYRPNPRGPDGPQAWRDAPTPSFDFSIYEYRVKPVPFETWVILSRRLGETAEYLIGWYQNNRDAAEADLKTFSEEHSGYEYRVATLTEK